MAYCQTVGSTMLFCASHALCRITTHTRSRASNGRCSMFESLWGERQAAARHHEHALSDAMQCCLLENARIRGFLLQQSRGGPGGRALG